MNRPSFRKTLVETQEYKCTILFSKLSWQAPVETQVRNLTITEAAPFHSFLHCGAEATDSLLLNQTTLAGPCGNTILDTLGGSSPLSTTKPLEKHDQQIMNVTMHFHH